MKIRMKGESDYGKDHWVNVEGMMCPHCEARVNEAVKAAFQAERCCSSTKKDDCLYSAGARRRGQDPRSIKNAGYVVTGITQE